MVFSDVTLLQGIVQQTRAIMRVDATQWPTAKIVASVNNWLDFVTGYAIGADSRFRWDDTNHTALPEGTTTLTSGQSDYSFLTDEQGNTILNLRRLELKDSSGNWFLLKEMDDTDLLYDAVGQEQSVSSQPTHYDKIADNIIRLYPKPNYTLAAALKFFFQRTPSYFDADDTTKQPGVAPILHRGFVVAAAYDGALTLGLPNLQALAVERQFEKDKMVQYFAQRNPDVDTVITVYTPSFE